MTKLFLIDTEFGNYPIASRLVKFYAQDSLNEIINNTNSQNFIILLKNNLIGFSLKHLTYLLDIKNTSILAGYVGQEPCLVVMNAELFDDYTDVDKLFDKMIKNEEKTDLVNIFSANDSISLIDSAEELIKFEQKIQDLLRRKFIKKGVFFQDPATVYLSYDTEIGPGVIIEPYVNFLSKVVIHKNVRIRSFSYLEDVEIWDRAIIGPFSRIRGNTKIKNDSKVGNFVEIKNSTIDSKSKINHLSYIGDAEIGKEVNIGAGVVTCNYDGKNKHFTKINDNSFIGSNSTLIAPINIGKQTIIGAASFINKDVPENMFAVARSNQKMKKNNRV